MKIFGQKRHKHSFYLSSKGRISFAFCRECWLRTPDCDNTYLGLPMASGYPVAEELFRYAEEKKSLTPLSSEEKERLSLKIEMGARV